MDQVSRFRKTIWEFTVGTFALIAAQVVDADLLLATLEGTALALVDVHALSAIVFEARFTRR